MPIPTIKPCASNQRRGKRTHWISKSLNSERKTAHFIPRQTAIMIHLLSFLTVHDMARYPPTPRQTQGQSIKIPNGQVKKYIVIIFLNTAWDWRHNLKEQWAFLYPLSSYQKKNQQRQGRKEQFYLSSTKPLVSQRLWIE